MTYRYVEPDDEPRRGLISMAGPSGCGKTFSALRVATGIREGLQDDRPIGLVDSELRGNLYHHRFKYQQIIIDPPFAPKEWMDLYRDIDSRFSVIISDNFSDEYEGPGGIAEMVGKSTLKNDIAKWAEPKAQHKALMSKIRLLKSQHIFLLRASDKIELFQEKDADGRPVGKQIVRQLGWQPHAEKNFKYDITIGWMLPPDCKGHANVWKTIDGFDFRDGEQLSEEHGRAIARWIKGETIAPAEEKPAVMTLVTIRSADNVPYVSSSIWKEAYEAYREVRKPVAEDPEALADLRAANRDALMILAKYAGPKASASLQAEIDAAGQVTAHD